MSLNRVLLCCLAVLHLVSAHWHHKDIQQDKPIIVIFAAGEEGSSPPVEVPKEEQHGPEGTTIAPPDSTGYSPPAMTTATSDGGSGYSGDSGISGTSLSDLSSLSGDDYSSMLEGGNSGASGTSADDTTLTADNTGGSSAIINPDDQSSPSEDKDVSGGSGTSGPLPPSGKASALRINIALVTALLALQFVV